MNKYAIGAILLAGMAIARVAATYTTFNEAYDEPFHIANGMEWLQQGTFTNQYRHPPLAGIVSALGPFLHGLRSPRRWNPSVQGESVIFEEGNEILYSKDDYWTALTLARVGTLLFLALALSVTFLWARRWFGEAAGFWAVLLLACTPPILGHAGLATNDVAGAAGVAFALYRFMRWLETPDLRRCFWWGFAMGIAFLCKFSSFPFLLACYALAVIGLALRREELPGGRLLRRIAHATLAAGVAFLLMWAAYRFTVTPLSAIYGPHPRIDAFLADRPFLHGLWTLSLTVPLPLAEVLIGLRDLYRHNALGLDSYLLGEWSRSGWWYFFPVVLSVKTPIGLLALAAGGIVAALWHLRRTPWQHFLTALFPVTILLVAITARIDLGVRHILPIYPLLAVIGGHTVSVLVRRSHATAVLALLLAGWAAVASWRAHPDYLAAFNEFAGTHPERILCESDLDWGQDLHRLSRRLKAMRVRDFSIAYFGMALLPKADLPHYELLSPSQPTRGYVAVSLHHLCIDYKKDGSFAWLKSYQPIERIGKSIDLFYIDH